MTELLDKPYGTGDEFQRFLKVGVIDNGEEIRSILIPFVALDEEEGGWADSIRELLESIDLSTDASELTLASKLDPIIPFTTIISSSGSNPLITPASGSSLQVRWLYGQARSANSGPVLVEFERDGVPFYTLELDPGQPFMHSAVINFDDDEPLSASLSASRAVIINADYREVS